MKRSEKTRQKILKVAQREFSEKGFDGVRVDRIAVRAGINKERLYAYYGSKRGLFSAVLEYEYQAIEKAEQSFLQLTERDIPDLGRIVLRKYMDFHAQHPFFWRILAWENLSGGKQVLRTSRLQKDSLEYLRKLYEKGQKSGHCRKGVDFKTFFFVLAAISFFAFSNQKTSSKKLELNMLKPKDRDQFLFEIGKILEVK